MKKIEDLCLEVENIVNELNNLSYKDSIEDSLILENIERLDLIESELNGIPQLNKLKTSKYLQ